MNDEQRQFLLNMAIRYIDDYGISVVPMTGKRPLELLPNRPMSWQRFALKPISKHELEELLANPRATGLAAVCGEVSHGLCAADYDRVEDYQRWKDDHLDVANMVATTLSGSGLGRHILVRCPNCKQKFNLRGGDKFIAGPNLIILPGSIHPDTGNVYESIISITPTTLIEIESPADLGWYKRNSSDAPSEYFAGGCYTSHVLRDGVRGYKGVTTHRHVWKILKDVINKFQPNKHGERNNSLFKFARAIKCNLGWNELSKEDLAAIFEEWWQLAKHNIPIFPI